MLPFPGPIAVCPRIGYNTGDGINLARWETKMKKKRNKLREFLRLLRPGMILLILTVYLAICLVTWLILRGEGADSTFWDVVSFNLLAITVTPCL